MKNIVRTFILILSVQFFCSAHALPRFEEDAENENADAVSKWSNGNDPITKKSSVRIARPLSPISDSSFDRDSSRSPASVGRGPAAGVLTPATTTQSSDAHAPPAALIRAMNQQKAYQEIAIIANDLGFFPSTVFVTQGIPVLLFITGASARSQCFMLDQFGVRRQIRSEKIEEIQFTPDESGTFTFNCPMNGSKGAVVVKELDMNRLPASIQIKKDVQEGGDEEAAQAPQPVAHAKPHMAHSEITDDDFTRKVMSKKED